MRKLLPMMLCLTCLVIPISAIEITAPEVPEQGAALMPEHTDSFPEAITQMIKNTAGRIRPDLAEAARISTRVICMVILVSVLAAFGGKMKTVGELAGTAAVASALFSSTGAMILLARDTVQQLSDYGKLLLPVMTTALAAQGGITASAGLYIGTAFFDAFLGSLLSSGFVPLIYMYLGLAVAGGACQEECITRLRDMIKGIISWCLKTLLTIFTTYMSITGVVSGTTDAAALKATKVTISTVVPMVGGILADASEAVLVGAGVVKNAAGIYGILAILAVFLEPFARIGIHYLLLKGTAALCSAFGAKGLTGMIGDFSSAMGMLLAVTGSMCLLLLISTVCFLKGVN